MKATKFLTATGYAFFLFGVGAAIAAGSHTVSQKDKAFAKSELSIAAGDSVNFANDDSVKHNILIKDIDYNSGTQEPGQTVTATFDKAGKFKVRCGIHPKMKMTVVVN